MSASDERLRILRMVEAGQVSAEEGTRLLGALDEGERGPGRPTAQWVRVRVTDMDTGRPKVNVNIPAGLLSVGLRLGARFGATEPGAAIIERLLADLKAGATGKVMDVENSQEAERVEVFVE